MGETLTLAGLYYFGELVMETIESELMLGWRVDDQDVEMLEMISNTIDERRK